MVRRLTIVYAWLLLVIFGGILIYTPLSVWLGTMWPASVLWIKSWKELLMLLTAALGVVLVTRQRLWAELFRDWIIRLIAFYVALHLVLAVVMPHTTATVLAGLAADLRYILYFGLVYVLLKLAPEWRRPFLRIGAIGAVIVIGFAVAQTMLPKDLLTHIGYSKQTIVPYLTVDQNPDFIRYGSTLRGPNPLGAYTIIVLAVVAALMARGKVALGNRRTQIVLLLVTLGSLIALWVSYSRSAAIGAVVAVVLVAARSIYRRLRGVRRRWLLAGAVVLVVVLGATAAWKSSFISNVVLHENPQGGSTVSSNEGHAESLRNGIARLGVQPLGAGIGSTGSASLYGGNGVIIENQYLFVAHEAGWLGLVVFVALFIMIMMRLWRGRADWLSLAVFASGLGLAIVGLLLPVWADDTIGIVWWGLAGLALGGSRGKQ